MASTSTSEATSAAATDAHNVAAAGSVHNSSSVEPELQDLEGSLQALETLDGRASPDLWPDQIPGVSQFVPLETPCESPAANVLQGLTQDDLHTIQQLGNLPLHNLIEEVKRLQNIAYQLGLEETKEMTRGKYLNILKK